jgi:hypothetical protein
MVNKTTKAFQSMMLSGRINEIMSEAVAEGIAETKKARERKFVPPVCFTPVSSPRVSQTEAELDAKFAIPEYVLKAAESKKSDPK